MADPFSSEPQQAQAPNPRRLFSSSSSYVLPAPVVAGIDANGVPVFSNSAAMAAARKKMTRQQWDESMQKPPSWFELANKTAEPTKADPHKNQGPCPSRCISDCGSAFAMGCIGGTVWHGVKGWRNAPAGYGITGASTQITVRASSLGGNFAVWGGLFSVFDCSFIAYRQKEDPLNAIMAGACTGGILAARAGPKAAAINALIGGALLGLIEGLGFMVSRMGASQAHQAAEQATVAPTVGMAHESGGGAPAAPGLAGGNNESGAPPMTGPRPTSLSTLQPRRTLASALESDSLALVGTAGQEIRLEDEDSTAVILNDSKAAAASAAALRKPVYSSAVEFSSEDFSFNDSDDFDDQ